MNYISEHYSVVMAVLLIGDVTVVSMTMWITNWLAHNEEVLVAHAVQWVSDQ